MNDTNVECVVVAASADSQFATVRVVKGKLAINSLLMCIETRQQYRLVSFALSVPAETEAKGVRVLQLAPADDCHPTSPLNQGMRLVVVRSNTA